jgi:hypothetical protein
MRRWFRLFSVGALPSRQGSYNALHRKHACWNKHKEQQHRQPEGDRRMT